MGGCGAEARGWVGIQGRTRNVQAGAGTCARPARRAGHVGGPRGSEGSGSSRGRSGRWNEHGLGLC